MRDSLNFPIGLSVCVLALTLTRCSGADQSSPTGLPGKDQTGALPPTSACPTYVDPTRCPPFSTAGTRQVAGVVTELSAGGRHALAGASVWLWVSLANGNGFRMRPAVTDSAGAYRFASVPDGDVILLADAEGFDQPCAAAARTVNRDTTTLNIDLVSRTHPLPSLASAPPTVSGVVFEMTADGRKPVPGALVTFESFPDLVTAMTTSDDAGRYSLCMLPVGLGGISAWRSPFALTDLAVPVSGSIVLDLELKR